MEKAEVKGKKVEVTINTNGEIKKLTADKVLSAIGVTGNVEGIGWHGSRRERIQGVEGR